MIAHIDTIVRPLGAVAADAARTTLAGLRAHKLRLLLTATAIMIGGSDSSRHPGLRRRGQGRLYDDLARAAKNVDAPWARPAQRVRPAVFDTGIVEEIKAVPGVAHADSRMAERLPMLDDKGRLISYPWPDRLGAVHTGRRAPVDDIGTGRRPADAAGREIKCSDSPPPSTASR